MAACWQCARQEPRRFEPESLHAPRLRSRSSISARHPASLLRPRTSAEAGQLNPGEDAARRPAHHNLRITAIIVKTEATTMTSVQTIEKYFWKELLAKLPINSLLLVSLIRK